MDHGPVRLAGRTLTDARHVCAFFNSRDEQERVLMPFFRDGFERGEKLVHIVDAAERDEHRCACQRYGIDTDRAIASGQLDLLHWEDSYLRGGHFDPQRVLGSLEETLDRNRPRFGRTRLMGTMEWSIGADQDEIDLIEYEVRVNQVAQRQPDPLICVYDLNRHSGAVILDVLRAHPLVIINGLLQENPLYVPPEEFLEELRERRGRPTPA